ncbi:hypothetical protein [Arthrobacter psychrolactophilus]
MHTSRQPATISYAVSASLAHIGGEVFRYGFSSMSEGYFRGIGTGIYAKLGGFKVLWGY